MDKADLERWLNKLAKVAKQLAYFKDFNDDIQLCPQCVRGVSNIPYIQLYSGIQTIAEMFDLEVNVEEDEDSVTRSFIWKGVIFLQYKRKGEYL